MRLLIAVPFPQEVKEQIDLIKDRVEQKAKRGRFTSTDNHHITLLFLGEQPNCKEGIAAMEQVSSNPFTLTLSGLGKFCNDGGAIVWIGVNEEPKLDWIHSQLTAALPAIGTDKRFRPHVTLGRQVILQGELKEIQIEPITVPVDAITLMESRRIDGKPVYIERFRKELEP